MQVLSLILIVLLASGVRGTVELTVPTYSDVTIGQPFVISWTDAAGSVTLTLVGGPASNLHDVETIETDLSSPTGSYSWTPGSNLAAETYAIMISDGLNTNYGTEFELLGVTSAASTSPSVPASSSAPTQAPSSISSVATSASTNPSSTTNPTLSTKPSSTSSTTPTNSVSSTSPTSSTGSASSVVSTSAQTVELSSTGTSTIIPTNTEGAQSRASSSNGLSNGAKAGIGAGLGVVGLLIIALALWYFLRNFSISKRETGKGMDVPVHPELEDTNSPIKHEIAGKEFRPELEQGVPRQEIDNNPYRPELETETLHHELPEL